MTTAKQKGEKIHLAFSGYNDVTIEGIEETPIGDERDHEYTLTSQNLTLRGDIVVLKCFGNQITALDVSQNKSLHELYCYNNQISGERMTQLVHSLCEKDRAPDKGTFAVMSNDPNEGNLCLKSDLAIAQAKNWNTLEVNTTNGTSTPCEGEGEEPQRYAVSFTQVSGGWIDIKGANDLNAVPHGAKLTIIAEPLEDYDLTALTANGEDILATKSIVVTAPTTILATFTSSKVYSVSLSQEGEGKLSAIGADNL